MLSSNPLGDRGVTALAGALAYESMPALRDLGLDDCRIGDAGCIALAGALGAAIGEGAMAVLAQSAAQQTASTGATIQHARARRSARKVRCGIVHTQESLITVTRDFWRLRELIS